MAIPSEQSSEQSACKDALMCGVRRRQVVQVTATSRRATARRLAAARILAGGPSLRSLARETGMSYRHLEGVSNGSESLLPTDVRDLSRVLDVPAEWLARDWSGNSATTL
jgi:hypothetical protein